MPGDVVPLFLRLAPRDIAYVKFVVESYEGVAVLRTLDADAALLVVLAAPDFLTDARAIVAAVAAEGVCEEIPPPSPPRDWLE